MTYAIGKTLSVGESIPKVIVKAKKSIPKVIQSIPKVIDC